MQKLFQNLIWPAVAGNVAWAFFSVIIMENWSDKGVIARLAALLLLAIYLCYDWLRNESEIDNLKKHYWVGDAFLALTIIIFAITVQSKSLWGNAESNLTKWPLPSIFISAALAHLFGAWEAKVVPENKYLKRFGIAATMLSGVLTYFTVQFFWGSNSLLHLPSSLFIVLILWLSLRNKIYPKAGTQKEHKGKQE